MQDVDFLNPLNNPIFFEIVKRFAIVFVLGFVLIVLLNKGKLKGIWHTNVGKRYLSWAIIAPVYMGFVFIGSYVALLFMLIITFLAIVEVAKIANLEKQYTYTLYFLAVISMYITSFHEESFYMLPLIYFFFLTITTIKSNKKDGLFMLMFTMFIAIWIIFSINHFILLGHLDNEYYLNKALLILVGFAVALSDIGAYIIGKLFAMTPLDKYKIANNISPNKTYAGVLGNILGAYCGILILNFTITNVFSPLEQIILAIIIGVFGIMGDLVESLFKRYYKTKDSGNLIPGHGGILDRIDSSIRVILGVYYYALFVLR